MSTPLLLLWPRMLRLTASRQGTGAGGGAGAGAGVMFREWLLLRRLMLSHPAFQPSRILRRVSLAPEGSAVFETVGEEVLSGTVVARLTSSRGATAAPGLLEYTNPATQLPTKLPFGLQDLAVGGPLPPRLRCWQGHAIWLSTGTALARYIRP